MEDSVKQRLIRFIKTKGLSISEFQRVVNVSNGFVYNISKSIGGDKLLNILSAYPDLNGDWLLTGQGDMLRPSAPVPSAAGSISATVPSASAVGSFSATVPSASAAVSSSASDVQFLVDALQSKVRRLQRQIAELEAENERLLARLREKTA